MSETPKPVLEACSRAIKAVETAINECQDAAEIAKQEGEESFAHEYAYMGQLVGEALDQLDVI